MDRVILHSDMNNCYASIEKLHRPTLRHVPLAVGGDPEARHGIVLAKDQLAKKCGVKTGMALWQARQVCPDIVFVPPRMSLYLRFSKLAHEIYADYTNQQEAFGIDESWLDVTASESVHGSGREIAAKISRRIKKELGVTVSIGVSWNKIYAKLGSDYKKPDAITEFGRENYKQMIYPLPAEDLLYVGPSTKRKLHRLGIHTIGDLAGAEPILLHSSLGKMGPILRAFARGEDKTPVNSEHAEAPIKSIGNGMTAPRDLITEEDIFLIIYLMAESVAARLREHAYCCRVVEISVRDSELLSFTRQKTLTKVTDITEEIAREAMSLFREHYHWNKPVRSIGVRASSLCPADTPYQMDLAEDPVVRDKMRCLDKTVDEIRRRFGFSVIQKGVTISDASLSPVDAKSHHTVHPHSYMEFGNRTGVENLV